MSWSSSFGPVRDKGGRGLGGELRAVWTLPLTSKGRQNHVLRVCSPTTSWENSLPGIAATSTDLFLQPRSLRITEPTQSDTYRRDPLGGSIPQCLRIEHEQHVRIRAEVFPSAIVLAKERLAVGSGASAMRRAVAGAEVTSGAAWEVMRTRTPVVGPNGTLCPRISPSDLRYSSVVRP